MSDQDAAVHIGEVATPGLFTGPEDDLRQVVRVRVHRTRPAGPLRVGVDGPHVTTPRPRLVRADTAGAHESWVEVPVRTAGAPGDRLPATALVHAADGRLLASHAFDLVVAEPGWTVRLVPHFHYDPMWWNTQAAYTALWDTPPRAGEAEKGWEYTGVPAFTLVPLHLQQAADDPSYRFVLSEIDYLKPFWDTHPEHRDEIRQLIREGRLEIVGGTYNEPSTNLTTAETTVRSAVHGLGFHRGILGGDPRTAWQLDVFGHDPSFPSLMAGAGLDSAVFARGPHHQWGPMTDTWGAALRPPSAMQLPAEYDWIGPDGAGLLTHYLPAHYSAGWFSHRAESADAAAGQLLDLYELLRTSAATRNVLIPMGTDFSWPHPWGLDVQHAWNRRYTWPRMEHSGPREHFAAVRAELASRGERPLPVTREMGPVYTGKDVTYADVKQAHRAAEYLVQEAETCAALVHSLLLAQYPADALDKAWRHLLHASHHDAVTGTFSDQVYLDLLPTWREAHELAASVRASALGALVDATDTRAPWADGAAHEATVPVTVFNPVSWVRTDMVRTQVTLSGLRVPDAAYIAVRDAEGTLASVHVERVHEGVAHLAFLARDLPSLGQRTWWLVAADEPLSGGWAHDALVDTCAITNDAFRVEADPERGGGLSRVTDLRSGRELLTDGQVDELVVQDEYPEHPYFEEGPWHLLPKGPGTGSGAAPADSVTVERGPLGARLVVTGRTGAVRWTRTTTLWDGLDRVELGTRIDEFDGSDQLLRLRVPADVPGALPVMETAAAAVGRGFAFPATDTGADHTRAPWTLDTPCLNWFALSSTFRVDLDGDGGARPLGAGEIVLPDAGLPGYGQPTTDSADPLRDLVTALVHHGVTTTPTRAKGPRWGDLAVDSSLPDFRLAVGGPDVNSFTAAVLADAGPEFTEAVRSGQAPLVWVPARTGLREAWRPGCDLTGARDLPVAVLTDSAQLGTIAGQVVREGRLTALRPVDLGTDAAFEDRTVALLVRGTPSCAIDTEGRLHSTLMRSCTGRPSAAWMDPPRRTAPDGSSFQLQHWTHVFEHALVASDGDWRQADLVRRGREFNQPPTAVTSTPHDGPAPGEMSLLSVEPSGQVLVETVKKTDDGSGFAVRLRETRGRAVRARLHREMVVLGLERADLLDRPLRRDAVKPPVRADLFDLRANDYATLRIVPEPMPATQTRREPVQPVFSRYWLHNTGTAPLGNAPYSVQLTPYALTAGAAALRTQVTVTSNEPRASGDLHLRVLLPDGWTSDWAQDAVHLTGGDHVRIPLVVRPAADAESGDHLVRVVVTTPAGAVEDCLTVTVPGHPGPPPGMSVEAETERVDIAPGGQGELAFLVHNGLRSALHGEALVVSPYGGRRITAERRAGLRLPAGETTRTVFRLAPPVDTPPGVYWVLVKAVCQGRVAYGPAVAVHVAARPHRQDGATMQDQGKAR